ncbi:MAG: hypothetical protein HFJ80_07105 [Clostridiales bacterium]|nr:hypothetical protein [Clostridiales bacterium]
MMVTFPYKLDDAPVLEFADYRNLGTIKGDDRTVRYFSICRYPSYPRYFVLDMDYDFEEKMCKKRASQYGDMVQHKK